MTDTALATEIETPVDPKLSFLQRAAARLALVESGEMHIEDAYGGVVNQLQCTCTRKMIARWERKYPAKRSEIPKPTPQEAAQSIYDALLWQLREGGLKGLKDATALQRLGSLSSRQLEELIAALSRYRRGHTGRPEAECYPPPCTAG